MATFKDNEKLPALMPVAKPQRLDSLDLLRGFGILGILLMNTQSTSMPCSAYENPADYPSAMDSIHATGIMENAWQYGTWIVIHVLADMKFVTIFSIMFGAGIAIQADRALARGRNPWAVHYLRMAVLLLFGIIHAYLIWFGDILVMYCECGLLLFPLRRLRGGLLIFIGIAMAGVYPFVSYYESVYEAREDYKAQYGIFGINAYQSGDPGEISQARAMGIPPPPPDAPRLIQQLRETSTIILHNKVGHDQELQEFRGDDSPGLSIRLKNYAAEVSARRWISLENETTSFLEWEFWRFGGCMLIGMGLYRLRFFHGEWTRQAYAALAAFAIPVGWLITIVGVIYNNLEGWNWTTLAFEGLQFNYWGSLVTAFGYLSFGTLLAIWVADNRHRLLELALIPVRSIGKMALSNYILQSLIDTTIFYGHGFGLFGSVSRIGQVGIAMCIWALNMTLSVIWLRHFRQGPLEWLWHTIVYLGQRPNDEKVTIP